jgi:putative aminopeptidase FrvX
MKLLEHLISIQGASSDEAGIRDFIVSHVLRNKANWKVQPELFYGDPFQDCVILVFGQPRTAVYAHMDTIGFSVGYENQLIKIGSPRLIDETPLVGMISGEEIETELMLIEDEDGHQDAKCVAEPSLPRGTILTFKPNFRLTEDYVQSPYLDNRLGVWNALQLCETLENGAIVFSTYEEHGGNSVGFCAKFLMDTYGVRQALISDITWVTEGVRHGNGVAISMRDSGLPRRSYLNRIIELAKLSGVPFQLEVESAGGSDGTMLQRTHLPIDWCFIGAPEDHVHSPDEKVHRADIESMVRLYRYLIANL